MVDSTQSSASHASHQHQIFPVLALRNVVLMPQITLPFLVGRDRSVGAIKAALAGDKALALLSQREADTDEPSASDLYNVGTVGTILESREFPDGTYQIVVRGEWRFRVESFVQFDPYIAARVSELDDAPPDAYATPEAVRSLRELALRFIKATIDEPPAAMLRLVAGVHGPDPLCYILASGLPIPHQAKQGVLEALDPRRRVQMLLDLLDEQLRLISAMADIQRKTQAGMSPESRMDFLREQRDTIRQELADMHEGTEDYDRIAEKVRKARLPKAAAAEAREQLDRLRRMPPGSPEYDVIETYLDWVTALPWRKRTRENTDLSVARKILDANHYDLKDVKERILEHLAARVLKARAAGVILCLVGPPGVGKTSLGQSIADATNRKLARISLGGVNDEAEIRGHRRTYVGALPGRILRVMRQAGVLNPLLVLDEVDKLTTSLYGDPTSALLEVLDPELNGEFVDHYLDLPFDLSHVFFLATANTDATIPPTLLDRMEVIHLPGYTPEEKMLIARQYLIPRQLERNGVTPRQLQIEDEALALLIDQYSREAGVRSLERHIASLCRNVARSIVAGEFESLSVGARTVERLLGAPPFHVQRVEPMAGPGVVSTVAMTEMGAELMTVEAFITQGRGAVHLTGRPGEMAEESARIALSHLRSIEESLGLPRRLFAKSDVHIHLTCAQEPLDSTSCGLPIFIALVSRALDRPPPKDTLFMGEITLHGRVLRVDAVRERFVCARRYGFTRIGLPAQNRPDLSEVPEDVMESLKVVMLDSAADAMNMAWPKERKSTPAKARS